ncbi:hypothetical protein GWI33_017663 [Rhynchophorus ferrugineus]|uniref:Uncharacterized protein n=1 Tax=Rhynchophorus ferrugineus TaxID=354439 RepID=A0A834HY04_RHYFE|nr:hypothetical protein GWI33_017663 [Rhynchophorus ferrugineus]
MKSKQTIKNNKSTWPLIKNRSKSELDPEGKKGPGVVGVFGGRGRREARERRRREKDEGLFLPVRFAHLIEL